MFEFRLTPACGLQREEHKRSRRTVSRLKRLTRIAVTLARANWPVWITMTGLAFIPADAVLDEAEARELDPFEDEYSELVAANLAKLGIHEEFSCRAGRTVDEMSDGMAAWMWDPRG
jgi:hypothetical protein